MDTDFFKRNRKHLGERLKGGLVVLCAYRKTQQRSDMAAPFLQEANFWYTTGIEEADWRLIIDGRQHTSWLVAPKRTEVQRIFEGGLSDSEALAISGADGVLSSEEFEPTLRELARHHSVVYSLGDDPHASYYDFELNPAQRDLSKQLERLFPSMLDCRPHLARLRAIKQPEELLALKRAIDLTVAAYTHVATTVRDSARYEYEIEAEFSAYFRRSGSPGHAYQPIVAAGGNACTLHYTENSARLKKRSLLLLDIGASVDGYAADISRTWAIGQPTKRQQALHAAVRAAHSDIIGLLRPGLAVRAYYEAVDERMKEALIEVGLLQDPTDEATYRRYFPHAISHGLGIDVHDSLGAPTYFEENMVLTVEPGIYVPEEMIGIRLEDDVVITATGNTVLSRALSLEL